MVKDLLEVDRPKKSISWSTVLLLGFCTLNIAITIAFQCTIYHNKETLRHLRLATEKCGEDNSEMERFLANSVIDVVKESPSVLHKAAHVVSEGLTRMVRERLDASLSFTPNGTTSARGDLFPDNAFEVGNNMMLTDFTPLMYTLSNFSHDFAQGLFVVNSGSMGSIGDFFEALSKGFFITAEQVVPLSSSHSYAIDSSVVGNVVSNLPVDFQESLSDREQIDTTTQDCVVLSARLFAVNWDLTYEQRHLEGPPTIGHIDGSNDLQVFSDINAYCQSIYLGNKI
eukprot:CAMPEP_0201475306 /NCGR_PEP_ID=MMETSP0151_2-20130828/752_1 /ASSEMBLY_ACC=CAM_ASM_000257 /TAXON_ID=200890 /ORGANISM="Paramoeba atlantica, Strain 621/1 / CCAP 1560/9" /LENGTH=283 /DNA_ID=CAMNT_0047855361 /DNA_START=123 /DNA_END=974 /DNA_ORIENTATION=+